MPRSKTALLLALKIAVLAGILIWILGGLDFKSIGATLRKFPPGIFLLAMATQALAQILQAWRWKVLVGPGEARYRDYLGFVSLGYSLALISPSVLISDSANAWLMGKRNQTVVRSVSAMLAGRALGMMVMAAFFLTALPGHLWVFAKTPWEPRVSFFAGLAAVPVLGVLAYWALRRFGDKGRRVLEQLRVVFSRPSAWTLGLALSAAVQALTLLLPWLGFHAMGIPVAVSDILFFAPLITLLALAPVSIGQIGLREGLGIFFYTLLPGVTKEHMVASFGYGYALFAVMGLLNLGLAGWILRRSKGA